MRVLRVAEDGSIEVESSPEVERLGLGRRVGNTILLDTSELAYMVYRGIEVTYEGSVLNLSDVFKYFSKSKYDWIKFSVLADLRNRGRRARAAYGVNTLIYERGSGKFMVFVTEENAPITASELDSWVDIAAKKGFEAVIAVVDAHGDVTYYKAWRVHPEDLVERGG